jgi:hypothetical protein
VDELVKTNIKTNMKKKYACRVDELGALRPGRVENALHLLAV